MSDLPRVYRGFRIHDPETGTPLEVLVRQLGLYGVVDPKASEVARDLLEVGNWRAGLEAIHLVYNRCREAKNPPGAMVHHLEAEGVALAIADMSRQEIRYRQYQSAKNPQ